MFKDPYVKFFMNSAPPAPESMSKKATLRPKKSAIKYAELLTSEELADMQETILGPITRQKNNEAPADTENEDVSKTHKNNSGLTY